MLWLEIWSASFADIKLLMPRGKDLLFGAQLSIKPFILIVPCQKLA